MCTTEPQKVPTTVLSRCQRFDFRRGGLDTILQKLRTICEREGLRVQPEALEFIARRATGSFRDAESLLDQLSAYGHSEITLQQVQGILGVASPTLVAEVVRAVITGDVPSGLNAISQAFDGGAEPRQFAADLLEYLRYLMLFTVGGASELDSLGQEVLTELRDLTRLPGYSLGLVVRSIHQFSDATQGLRYAARPELPLELALVEVAAPASAQVAAPVPAPPPAARAEPVPTSVPSASPQPPERVTAVQRAPDSGARAAPEEASSTIQEATPSGTVADRASAAEAPPAGSEMPSPGAPGADRRNRQAPADVSPAPPSATEPADTDAPSTPALTLEWVRGHWQKVLIHVRSNSRQVEALLKSAEPIGVRGTMVFLGCEAEFHAEALSGEKRRQVVEDALQAVLGVPCTVSCSVKRPAGDARPDAAPEPPTGLFASSTPRKAAEERLLSHPAVKELTRQGGKVTKVEVDEPVDTEEDRGQ